MKPETRDDSSTHRFLRTTSSGGFQYQILEEIGRGGMGIVFKARHIALNKLVALKLLPDERGFGRFKREAQVLARLEHPHLVRVEDFGIADGSPFFTMRLLEGHDLKRVLRAQSSGRLPPRVAAEITLKIARALQHCHANGVLHRDLKPSNIFLEDKEPERPVLLDFGLAKAANDHGEDPLTHSGMALGTLAYMSPEQMLGQDKVGPASDVWGLAATLYHLVIGRPPFAAASMIEVYRKATQPEAIAPSRYNPDIPPWLDQLLSSCLQAKPEERPALPLVIEALEEGLRRVVVARPRGRAPIALLSALGGVAVGLAAGFVFPRASPIILDSLQAPRYVTKDRARIRGRAGEEALAVIAGDRVDERALRCPDGRFDLEAPVRDGIVSLRLRRGDQERTLRIPVIVDQRPPTLELQNREFEAESVLEDGALVGRVKDSNGVELTAEGRPISTDADGRFLLRLAPGESVTLVARDAAGNKTTRRVRAARILGPDGLLGDRERWRRAPQDLQDRAIARASELLDPLFARQTTEVFRFKSESIRLAVFQHRRSQAIFHLIPGGAFTQGATDLEAEERFLRSRGMAEMLRFVRAATPPRQVRVPPLLVMRYELRKVVVSALRGSELTGPPGQVIRMTWKELGPLLDAAPELRLPSEAEWDYAARAGATTRFFWGDEPDRAFAWAEAVRDPRGALKMLRQDRANAFGLFDTQGGYWEWVADIYSPDLRRHRGHGPYVPTYIKGRPPRIARGGSWQNPFASASFNARFRFDPDVDGLVTVRLVADIPWPSG